MNAIVKTNSQVALALPASLAALFGDVSAHVDDLSGGVQSGFPVISYRGKVWRIRKGGDVRRTEAFSLLEIAS